jgi:hypothetical protein
MLAQRGEALDDRRGSGGKMQPHPKRNRRELRPAGQLEAVQTFAGKTQAVEPLASDLAGLFPQSTLRRPNEAQARAPPDGVAPGGSMNERPFQKKLIEGL